MRKIVLILLVVLVKSTFAIDCGEALANLSGATTDIRANHNGQSSFILEDQGSILEQDNAIMEKYDYENSLNFYRQNCK